MSYTPGSGNGGSIAGSSDVALSNATNGDVLTYVGGNTNKWENLAGAVRDTKVDHGSVSGAVTLDLSAGNIHVLNLSGSTTLAIANWPTLTSLTVRIISNGHTVVFPNNWQWLSAQAGSVGSAGTDILSVFSADGGASVQAIIGNFNLPGYVGALLNLAPVSVLTLDETSGSFADASGNGNAGTANGTITRGQASLVPSDHSGSSVTLDGSSGYITMSAGVVPSPLSGAFSIVFTLQAAVPGSSSVTIYAAASSSTNNPLFQIASSTNSPYNTLRAYLRDDSNTPESYFVDSSAVAFDSTAHHCIFTYNNGKMTWYIDGQQAGTASGTPPSSSFSPNRWSWGAVVRSSATQYLNGSLDALATFNVELSASQVTTLHAAWSASQ